MMCTSQSYTGVRKHTESSRDGVQRKTEVHLHHTGCEINLRRARFKADDNRCVNGLLVDLSHESRNYRVPDLQSKLMRL